ncbi:class I SAM-dependent methyltransferase [Desulfogranum japonicum]|uniref:class I SAM-dependent methyltransferase n=1 Tax=Desulfogranum japonicum TaxID=231447 RepID=UPI00041D6D47|nr:methyltransferase domain-containing protein [Desulfogranum japonicum]
MNAIVHNPRKDPLGTMLLDYLDGGHDACIEVISPTLAMGRMPAATMFRKYRDMPKLEQLALHHCTGRILDVGAGSGCHSLYLQNQGLDVLAVDISPGCVQAMHRQYVHNPRLCDVFSLQEECFDTILMLMNGLGICGTLDGVNLFLQFVDTILAKEGQILVDSTDLEILQEEEETSACDEDVYLGETSFVMRYRDIYSDPFDWVYADYATLQSFALLHNFQCQQLYSDNLGRYLARIFR